MRKHFACQINPKPIIHVDFELLEKFFFFIKILSKMRRIKFYFLNEKSLVDDQVIDFEIIYTTLGDYYNNMEEVKKNI